MAQISIAQTDSKESILSRLNRVIFKVKETVSKNEGDRDERQLFYLLSSLYYNDSVKARLFADAGGIRKRFLYKIEFSRPSAACKEDWILTCSRDVEWQVTRG